MAAALIPSFRIRLPLAAAAEARRRVSTDCPEPSPAFRSASTATGMPVLLRPWALCTDQPTGRPRPRGSSVRSDTYVCGPSQAAGALRRLSASAQAEPAAAAAVAE